MNINEKNQYQQKQYKKSKKEWTYSLNISEICGIKEIEEKFEAENQRISTVFFLYVVRLVIYCLIGTVAGILQYPNIALPLIIAFVAVIDSMITRQFIKLRIDN